MTKDQKKIEKAFRICRASAKKYGYGPKKTEKCIRAVKKKLGVGRPK